MDKKIDLTEGGIVEKLVKIAIPIMATSFIQIAYNLIDMMWVGKNGSNSVAAVGTAGFYPWLAMAFVMFSKIGGEVKVAQSMGEKNTKEVKSYIKSSIELNVFLSITYTLVLILFNKQLIDIFNLGDLEVITMSRQYLVILAIGMIFYFINPVFTSIFIGLGNSSIPFRINTIGLIANIILDPLLIFGFGPIDALGTNGAGIATITAQIIVTCVFVGYIIKNKIEYFKVKYFRNIELEYFKTLYKLGLPVAIQNALFTLISMAMGVIVASFGPVAVAVQKVGSQIESISWMSADGFASALSTFTGQNYGAYKFDRINKGSKIGLIGALIWGSITTLVLVFLGDIIFRAFINEPDAIIKGVDYLKILGYSQLFMCIEITITGILKGLGRTYIPSVTSIVLNLARIPMAIVLSKPDILGINGIWWSISISSIFKGIILLSIFVILNKSKKLYKSNNKNNLGVKDELCS
ncbi:MATE family efflux transporter [Intestinibacter sp.]|jgi:putative MATE family efflux protein|uniref:MATE family efflux transporter n=1 Tax=Intestinibacter sp. TaxID=1965304 RepID=UPI0025EB5FA8|nr:MATE family efflux transporter [uncultured Intestinibacter sp.]